MLREGFLNVMTFFTESPVDALTVNGLSYSGDGRNRGPVNQRVSAGSYLTWATDGSNTRQGTHRHASTGVHWMPCIFAPHRTIEARCELGIGGSYAASAPR